MEAEAVVRVRLYHKHVFKIQYQIPMTSGNGRSVKLITETVGGFVILWTLEDMFTWLTGALFLFHVRVQDTWYELNTYYLNSSKWVIRPGSARIPSRPRLHQPICIPPSSHYRASQCLYLCVNRYTRPRCLPYIHDPKSRLRPWVKKYTEPTISSLVSYQEKNLSHKRWSKRLYKTACPVHWQCTFGETCFESRPE